MTPPHLRPIIAKRLACAWWWAARSRHAGQRAAGRRGSQSRCARWACPRVCASGTPLSGQPPADARSTRLSRNHLRSILRRMTAETKKLMRSRSNCGSVCHHEVITSGFHTTKQAQILQPKESPLVAPPLGCRCPSSCL